MYGSTEQTDVINKSVQFHEAGRQRYELCLQGLEDFLEEVALKLGLEE